MNDRNSPVSPILCICADGSLCHLSCVDVSEIVSLSVSLSACIISTPRKFNQGEEHRDTALIVALEKREEVKWMVIEHNYRCVLTLWTFERRSTFLTSTFNNKKTVDYFKDHKHRDFLYVLQTCSLSSYHFLFLHDQSLNIFSLRKNRQQQQANVITSRL